MSFLSEVLQDALRKYESNDSITITDVNSELACKPGDNYMSVVKRYYLKGKIVKDSTEQDYEKQLIVKVPPKHTKGPQDIFKFEAVAYGQIIPALEKTINEKLSFPTPIYLSETMVMLEDLTLRSYVLANRKVGLTNDQAKLTLNTISKLHATSMLLEQSDLAKYESLVAMLQDQLFSENTIEQYRYSTTKAFKTIQLRMDMYWKSEKQLRYRELFSQLDYKKIIEDMKNVVVDQTTDLFKVICHADCWFNNIMIKEDLKAEDPVVLIDLQQLCKTNMLRDVIYVLTTNQHLQPEPLLEHYVEKLKHHMNVLKINKERADQYTYDKILAEYKRLRDFHLLIGVWLSLPISFDIPPSSDPNDEIVDEVNITTVKTRLSEFFDNKVLEMMEHYFKEQQ